LKTPDDRFRRSDVSAPGNWNIFLNIINVDAKDGLSGTHLVKALHGLEQTAEPFGPSATA